MWNALPEEQRNLYKKFILGFVSLTEAFAQKKEMCNDNDVLIPYINSKYQEKSFQIAFNASAEDIDNRVYDAGIVIKKTDNTEQKYLVGIKTFRTDNKSQKIAQFKKHQLIWLDKVTQITLNANAINSANKKSEIDKVNHDLYLEIAKIVSDLRNTKIKSDEASVRGFLYQENDKVEKIYHVLMPSVNNGVPNISVGEVEYDQIMVDNIEILGCTEINCPTNFKFTDGKHEYKFTPSDCQLYMDFSNQNIILETWNVKYYTDPYSFFEKLFDTLYLETSHPNLAKSFDCEDCFSLVHNASAIDKEIEKSFSWLIANKTGQVELFSGLNSFNSVASKAGKEVREKRIQKLKEKYRTGSEEVLEIINMTENMIKRKARSKDEKIFKMHYRNEILFRLRQINNKELYKDICSLIYRPYNELYLPIPNAKKFHNSYPDFFGQDIGRFKKDNKTLLLKRKHRQFPLVFEPSGAIVDAYISQDYGKAIMSVKSQGILGEWVLREVFQLNEYEPLTTERLNVVGKNGIRIYKYYNSKEIHLEFIWIDEENLPDDFIE